MARYGVSVISELTQWSGSLTRLGSDLGQARQKLHLYNTFLGGLRQRSPNSDPMKKKKTQSSTAGATTKDSGVKSSLKPIQNETTTKKELQKKQTQIKWSTAAISTMISGEKLTLDKLNAYAIDWTDSRVTTLETTKYQKANIIE